MSISKFHQISGIYEMLNVNRIYPEGAIVVDALLPVFLCAIIGGVVTLLLMRRSLLRSGEDDIWAFVFAPFGGFVGMLILAPLIMGLCSWLFGVYWDESGMLALNGGHYGF